MVTKFFFISRLAAAMDFFVWGDLGLVTLGCLFGFGWAGDGVGVGSGSMIAAGAHGAHSMAAKWAFVLRWCDMLDFEILVLPQISQSILLEACIFLIFPFHIL
ncbi:MAG: hypothetical protein KGP29_07955 [Proteobacteria bacterium]|nr:hypothetical protein [Pseudomonadota bacterium]